MKHVAFVSDVTRLNTQRKLTLYMKHSKNKQMSSNKTM